MSRIAGHLWNPDDVFDFDNKEPNDYYRAYFEDKNGEPQVRLTNVLPDRLEVKRWNGEEFDQDDVIERYPLDWTLRVRRILKGAVQVRYDTEREFLWKDWWWPRAVQLRERLFRTAYERRTGIRVERLKVLEAILDVRVSDNDFKYILGEDAINSEQLVVKLFGRRALNREDDGGMLFSRIELIIDSLLESADIEVVGDAGVPARTVRPRGKALTTLALAATDERRHRDTKRLTWVLIFVGALQVIVALMQIQPIRDFAWAIWEWFFPPP